ncbi:hypothetical protein [Polaromonas naphthalenivorans]|uniref:hypothetical protein n=1 Tax=Polaromonas naphthalenivorans TaxID=216465 RepID=UPI00031F31C4|nr:hypothetical protein [Polaromonas naphthalenivorans]
MLKVFCAQGLGLMSALAKTLETSNELKAKAYPFITKIAEVRVQYLLVGSKGEAVAPYGDGRAAQKIVARLAEDLAA